MSTRDDREDDYWQVLSHSILERGKQCRRHLTVRALLEAEDHLDLVHFEQVGDLAREIRVPLIQRLGLALAGYCDDLEPGSLALLGNSEAAFLADHGHTMAPDRLAALLACQPAGLLLSRGIRPPSWFTAAFAQASIPVLQSQLGDRDLIVKLGRILVEALAPCISFHGNLLVISGLGVLILGKSGIGKSDDALDLIKKGHQLVADDVVQVFLNPEGRLCGRADELTRDHMDVRGLGIVNIVELFGIGSVLDQHPIDLVLYLETWDSKKNYDCFQANENLAILGVDRPVLRLPVAPGRNLENLIEIAVKHYLLKIKGYNAEKAIAARLDQLLNRDNG
ncbi:HPr(Ser) kinase/phosphatase [Sulfidibacter corallicola]|uniref:HPr(Ser) kinase/phosphatase n=1 Tax=Sulfidibacter corallicola TaxID=2818388 RepID=A0A8A4U1U8_SULCO|nr:HPr(Ser) kinase/phosphatase [Sulfidibacter corallicola]QTD52705.1 HPr(Ser) kinase/phosphatase [Sulfidibacter corallicola]